MIPSRFAIGRMCACPPRLNGKRLHVEMMAEFTHGEIIHPPRKCVTLGAMLVILHLFLHTPKAPAPMAYWIWAATSVNG